MKNTFYIKDTETDELIEVFKLNSKRYELVSSLVQEKNIQNGDVININKEVLKKTINELISQRKDNIPSDFGNRFDYDQCYQILKFEDNEYELETSGHDNLIIFAINLFNHSDNELKLVSM